MNDNEKLDNQRLKNFKNKGRDLEVSIRSSLEVFFLGGIALFRDHGFRCDVVRIYGGFSLLHNVASKCRHFYGDVFLCENIITREKVRKREIQVKP